MAFAHPGPDTEDRVRSRGTCARSTGALRRAHQTAVRCVSALVVIMWPPVQNHWIVYGLPWNDPWAVRYHRRVVLSLHESVSQSGPSDRPRVRPQRLEIREPGRIMSRRVRVGRGVTAPPLGPASRCVRSARQINFDRCVRVAAPRDPPTRKGKNSDVRSSRR